MAAHSAATARVYNAGAGPPHPRPKPGRDERGTPAWRLLQAAGCASGESSLRIASAICCTAGFVAMPPLNRVVRSSERQGVSFASLDDRAQEGRPVSETSLVAGARTANLGSRSSSPSARMTRLTTRAAQANTHSSRRGHGRSSIAPSLPSPSCAMPVECRMCSAARWHLRRRPAARRRRGSLRRHQVTRSASVRPCLSDGCPWRGASATTARRLRATLTWTSYLHRGALFG